MRSSWTKVIAAILAGIAVLLLRLHSNDAATDVVAVETTSAPTAMQPPAPPASRPSPAPAPPAQSMQIARADSDGSASGSIHFERAANDAAPKTQIDVNVRAAVGIWQPAEHRLRVLLLEHAPTPQQSASLLSSLQTEMPNVAGVPAYGIVDLHFTPTAQAFDRNDLETAALIASNAKGERSAADVLGGLEWSGSLPSPAAEGAPMTTLLELSAAGGGQSLEREAWQQTWRFNVSVPVSWAP